MVYSHWLCPGPVQIGCIVLCRTFHTAPEQRQGPEQGTGKNGLCTHFPGPETVSGGVLQWYFNSFQVSSPCPRHTQCEWFLHNIGPLRERSH